MTQPDPRRSENPPPERRKRPPPRGQHPSLTQSNAGHIASPEDFLGLDMEVQRARAQEQIVRPPLHVFTPPAQPDTRVSTNTTLIPRSHLFAPIPPLPSVPAPALPQRAPASSGHEEWKRMAKESLGALQPPEAPPARANSWLLALDDTRAGRAGVGPVVHDPSGRAPALAAPAQLNTSFAEEPPVVSRTMPWLIRGLIATAAGSFLFVVAHTVFSPMRPEPPVLVVPPVATHTNATEPPAELADPGPRTSSPAPDTLATRGRKNQPNRPVPASPARPFVPAVETPAPAKEDPPPTFIEIAPAEFAPQVQPNGAQPTVPNASEQQSAAIDYALPPWYPDMVSTTPLARGEAGPEAGELAASPERKARVQRFLMQKSRGAAPIEDTSDTYTPPPVSTAGFTNIGGSKRAPKSQTAAPVALAPKQSAASDAGGVWDGAVVPVDQIASKVKISTPRVGTVRVTLASGDVREGRLAAVGQGSVWIEQEHGTESIARARIERLEQISGPKDALAYPGEKTPAKTAVRAAESRVRVRTAGGLFYGRIVAREGDTITLVTDEGSRVTIEGGSVEPAPERKTVVKREPAPKVKPAAQPIPSAHGQDPNLEPEVPEAHSTPPG